MLLQTNSYIVPKEKRAEHSRLIRRFRQTLLRLGCDHFEVYEQVGSNWSNSESGGRYVQILRFVDRKHQLAVQAAERNDPTAQAVIADFCELINFPYQQQQGLFAVGFYTSVLPIAPKRGARGELISTVEHEVIDDPEAEKPHPGAADAAPIEPASESAEPASEAAEAMRVEEPMISEPPTESAVEAELVEPTDAAEPTAAAEPSVAEEPYVAEAAVTEPHAAFEASEVLAEPSDPPQSAKATDDFMGMVGSELHPDDIITEPDLEGAFEGDVLEEQSNGFLAAEPADEHQAEGEHETSDELDAARTTQHQEKEHQVDW